jgi:uncharacterized glyoxalase superfamily protein PhnB
MIVNRSAPPGPIVPTLIYEDVGKAIEWLCHAFGFTERLRTAPEPDGSIHHAQLAVGEGAIILTNNRVGQSLPLPVAIGVRPSRDPELSHALYVRVEDVDKHCERAKQFGARILNPPANHAFGEKQYTAEDPYGHRWTFSQSVADVSPEEWGAKAMDMKSPVELLPRPRLCYLEIPAADSHQSAAFYENVFRWNIRHRDSARPSFDDATGYVSGAWVTGREIARHPGLLPYIWVNDIDATLSSAANHGGEIVERPHRDSPGGEWIATFRDPAGNLIGLYQEGSR